MIKKNTLIVFIIMVLAVAGFFVLQKTNSLNFMSQKSQEPTATTQPVLVSLSVDSITEIRYTAKGQDEVIFSKTKEGVWQTGDGEKTITANDIESLIDKLNTAETDAVVNLDLDGSSIGLTDPAYQFVFVSSDGSEKTVKIGDENPTKSGYYARTDMGQILVISRSSVTNVVNAVESALTTPTPMGTQTVTSADSTTPDAAGSSTEIATAQP